MAAVMEHTVRLTKTVPVSPDKVYEAWTDPILVGRWFAPSPEMGINVHELDVRVGGRYRVEMVGEDERYTVSGEYLELVPDERIVMTWAWADGGAEGSVVTAEFRAVDGGTEIAVTHEKLPDEASRKDHEEGWTGAMEHLASKIESF